MSVIQAKSLITRIDLDCRCVLGYKKIFSSFKNLKKEKTTMLLTHSKDVSESQ